MIAAKCLLKCLEINGVKTIFGVPGEENADIMIALRDSNIDFVTCRHEQTASFMADMHGRMTGFPGVCLSTLGPGVTNLLTGIANANMDHAPLIAIIGQADTKRLHKESHQNMDSISMCKPISKWAVTIRDADNIPEIMAKAFKVATMVKPGAVVVELPEDLAGIDIDASPIDTVSSINESGVNRYQVKRMLPIIAKANNPIMLVGAGCIREDVADELKQFMDVTGIYAAHTFMAKGVVDDRHSQSLRCVGLGMKDIALEAFEKSDCVLCLGYDMVEWHPDHWHIGVAKKIINIDVVPAELDANYIPTMEMIGSIKHTLQILNEEVASVTLQPSKIFSTVRQQVVEDIDRYEADETFPIKPQRLISDVRSVLGDSDIVVCDVGAHKMWVARQYPTYLPKTCFIHNGFCSMGGAIPGATEACRLNPDKTCVAICGDGGFLMSIQALSTAATLKLPIVVIVFDDNHYGLIKWKQEVAFQQSSHTELDNPDFVKLSESFGCAAALIDSHASLKSAIEAAVTRKDKPTVLVVPIDYGENLKLNEHLGEIISH